MKLKQVNVRVAPSVVIRFKMACALTNKPMAHIVRSGIKQMRRHKSLMKFKYRPVKEKSARYCLLFEEQVIEDLKPIVKRDETRVSILVEHIMHNYYLKHEDRIKELVL